MQSNSSTMTYSEQQQGTTLLPFEKMHGLGNDFIIVNAAHLGAEQLANENTLAKQICDRHRGIGGDGLIIIDQVKDSEQAIKSWRYYNADGSVAEMCGNGIRCAAKYIYEQGLSGEETRFCIETLAGDIGVEMLEDEQVRVNMGAAREVQAAKQLELASKSFDYTFVSMGNPHAVIFTEDIESDKKFGPEIEIHSDFSNKTNVEFAKILNPNQIDLVVWERGCGFTQACGTGACATMVAAIEKGFCKKDEEVNVNLPGGRLIIKLDSIAETIFMTGKAEISFSGYYNS